MFILGEKNMEVLHVASMRADNFFENMENSESIENSHKTYMQHGKFSRF